MLDGQLNALEVDVGLGLDVAVDVQVVESGKGKGRGNNRGKKNSIGMSKGKVNAKSTKENKSKSDTKIDTNTNTDIGVNQKHDYGWCCPNCVSTLTLDNKHHMLGVQLAIYWEVDDMFYFGTINGYDEVSQSHRVLYEDLEWEFLELNKECVFYNYYGVDLKRELGFGSVSGLGSIGGGGTLNMVESDVSGSDAITIPPVDVNTIVPILSPVTTTIITTAPTITATPVMVPKPIAVPIPIPIPIPILTTPNKKRKIEEAPPSSRRKSSRGL
mgnify:CR=1 FL=1